MEKDVQTSLGGRDCDSLTETAECTRSCSSDPSLSQTKNSIDELDQNTDNSNSSRSASSSRTKRKKIIEDSASSSAETETKNSLLGEEKSYRNSANYLKENSPVIIATTGSPPKVEKDHRSVILVPNEQSNKLTRKEKLRIRKLRRKLAAVDTEKEALLDNNSEEGKDLEKSYNQCHFPHQPEYPTSQKQQLSWIPERRSRNFFGLEMFSKLSCVSCVDVLRECCGVANDEPTNGVKILRRRDPPVDLQTDLPTLCNVSVVQRLKLILEKLESGQLDTVPPEVLQKNIQYAIQLIQDGDAVKDRTAVPSQQEAIETSTSAVSTIPPHSTAEHALNNLSHIRQLQHQQLLQQQQRRQSSSTTSCVASSAAIIAAATASAAAASSSSTKSSSTNITTTTTAIAAEEEPSSSELPFPPPPQNTNLSSSITTTLTDSLITTTTITASTTSTTTTTTTSLPPSSTTTDTDLPNVDTIESETNTTTTTTVAVTAASSGGNDNDTTSTPETPTTAPPTIITPKTGRKSSIAGGAAAANDTLTVPESRRRDESDNELSEVDEEVIPEEVRKWLASTFTKTVQPKPRLEPRPRFRSVANAIRVGLFVDRFYRQLSTTTLEIPPDVQQYLKEANNWHFDIFRLHEKSSGHSLKYVAKELFSRYGIVSRFRLNLDKLESFLTAVEVGYTKLKNPYHNDIHAADVTQTLHYFIGSTGLANMFTDLEIFSLLFAALIHDFEHTGRTNNFHVNVGTELALLYNDRSVLENHHVSAAFRLLKEDDKSMLSNLKPEEFRDFRNLVIEMVLSTDMSTHFAQIKNVRAILNGEKVSSTTTMSLMSLLLHTADISHPGKPWRMHKKFADTILEEFFLQGDEEAKLGLPFSPLCDRNNVLIPESQISFIEFIVEPSLTIMTDLIDFVLNVDESSSSGPMNLSSSSSSATTTKPVVDSSSNSGSNSDPKSSNQVTNSSSSTGNNNSESNAAPSTTPPSESAVSKSDNNSGSSSNNNNASSTSSSSTVSKVPPPVPLRLSQAKSQIKPFQNLSANSAGGTTTGRRTESENCIKTAAASSSSNNKNNSLSDAAGGKIPLSSRTPSFPLQSGANHNYGPGLRPWINHLVENKAKWRMISAEAAAAAAANTAEEGDS